ncbi:D-alanyl-D-alanine carboxypeptidase/D-alanyl-D-alanine-endopeptidase [Prevotella sp. OH937_COT-195]|uniref:D-alanyl-D-alanine carboxypeptidase/D-alanyl-D-alanine endopeptidase n=1 Tax=Prevotella sp. OH937_COT-195 TaxID=2491051 RepID=UPI000F6512E3|nr:D-alanyl-D-alanine carboxypeptidase/D-alanyl-D-alanine-endopeptidase [Prevotella sp. OH937_COT-195]RRD02238.1 D-alanyl-D-alanine carboxypeptidase/D-alanyl-D-alanine-endopeptidase [Prevotella sp. OH937_COT-195]
MMKIKKICLLFFLCVATLNCVAQGSNGNDSVTIFSQDSITLDVLWEDNVLYRIEDIMNSNVLKTSIVGVEIYDLTDDKVIYACNERQTMRPASTQKMLTAVTALDRLGGDYEYKTQLCYTGEIDGRTLLGSLYCIGGFDPAFNGDDMESFVSAVREVGIDTIQGNIYADLSFKDGDRLGEGWCWDDDNPTLTPLMVDKKDNFIQRFTSLLRQRGMVLNGYTDEQRTPSSAKQLYVLTRPINQILNRMMKNSDNTYAESMFYQLGRSAKEVKTHYNNIIRKVGLNPSDYYVADGSGLSLYNYVSPHEEVAFLRYAFENKNIFAPLYLSMPVAGVDGTLKKRMRGTDAEGNVRAKTGTVTGVSSLAGYLYAPNGHFICFSIINMGVMKASTGRNFQDRLCEALCRP